MESLLLVVAELLSVPLLVAATLLCVFGGAALLLLGQLLLHRRARTRVLRWWRRIVWTAIGSFGLLLAGLVIVDLLLFGPALRIALDQIELRSGVDVSFREARGSLFLGRLELSDVTVRRSGGAGVEFSLTIRELVVDVDMLHVYRAALPVDLVRVVGVRGEIVRRQAGTGPRPLHAFVVDRLDLADVQLNFEDAITAPFRSLPLVFEHFSVGPLRSEWAMLDVLCASEARGSARGYAFGAGGRAWHARGIPIGPAAHKLGAVGRWIRGGDIDVTLRCGSDHDPQRVPLHVDLRLHNFNIAPPGDSGRHLPASRLAAALSRLGPDLTLHFRFELPQARFQGATNVAQLGLWEGAIEAWNVELGGKLGLGIDDLRMLGIPSRVLEQLGPGRTTRN